MFSNTRTTSYSMMGKHRILWCLSLVSLSHVGLGDLDHVTQCVKKMLTYKLV